MQRNALCASESLWYFSRSMTVRNHPSVAQGLWCTRCALVNPYHPRRKAPSLLKVRKLTKPYDHTACCTPTLPSLQSPSLQDPNPKSVPKSPKQRHDARLKVSFPRLCRPSCKAKRAKAVCGYSGSMLILIANGDHFGHVSSVAVRKAFLTLKLDDQNVSTRSCF